MWFWIWAFLILAALVGAFFLFRNLWRRFKGVPAGFSQAIEHLSGVSATVDQRSEARRAATPPMVNALATDPVELIVRVEEQRTARFARKMYRRRPRPEVFRRWLSIYR